MTGTRLLAGQPRWVVGKETRTYSSRLGGEKRMHVRSLPRTWWLGHYVLTGRTSRLGSRVRLLLTLTETTTGNVVWSDRLSQQRSDALFDGFDYLASQMVRGAQTEPKNAAEWRVMRPIGRRHRGAHAD